MRAAKKIILLLVISLLFTGQVFSEEKMSLPAAKPLPVLNVYTESLLFPVLDEFADNLRNENIIDIHISAATSENILQELKKDASKADIVILEGKESITLANRLEFLNPSDVVTIASDRLVAISHKGRDISSPITFLGKVEEGRLVIADPKKNMSGLHADQALKRIGLGERVDGKIRHVKTDALAVKEVAEQKADAAVVYLSSSFQEKKVKSILTMPKNSYFPVLYFASAMKHLKKNKRQAAKAIVARLSSMSSRDIWMKYGFSPPPKNMP